jgi:YidC/Oxa1 family membrane protein insertase
MLWSNTLEVIRATLFLLAHWCGGSFGSAILIGSAAARIALLPITLRAARRRVRQERIAAALAPSLAQIKKRYATQPARLMEETRKLHAKHGLTALDGRSLAEGLVQMPPAVALYSAIRGVAAKAGGFLWVADISKPDRWLAVVAAGVAAAVASISALSPEEGRSAVQVFPVVIAGVITLVVLTHLSAGLALYSIANSVIGGAERRIAIRAVKRE